MFMSCGSIFNSEVDSHALKTQKSFLYLEESARVIIVMSVY